MILCMAKNSHLRETGKGNKKTGSARFSVSYLSQRFNCLNFIGHHALEQIFDTCFQRDHR